MCALQCAALVVCCPIPGSMNLPPEGKQVVEELRVAHKAAIESIHQLSCRLAVSYQPRPMQGDPRPMSCQYWRAPNKVRIRVNEGGRSIDALCDDSRSWVLSGLRGDKGELLHFGTIGSYAEHGSSDLDVWRQALFTLTAPGLRAPMPLSELLSKHPKLLRDAARKHENGRDYVVLQFANERAKVEYWFDSGVNFLVSRYRGESSEPAAGGTTSRAELHIDVTRFEEPVRGIYFPACVQHRYFWNGELKERKDIDLSELRINSAQSPEVFAFRFPAGTLVQDLIEGKEYRVGADGKPTGVIRELPDRSPPPTSAAGVRSPSLAEATPWTAWLLPGSMATLCLAGGFWLKRRWRSRRDSQLA